MAELSSLFGIVFTVLLLTSFVKILTSLTIFRIGIGLRQSGFGLVIVALSLALSLLVMSPQISQLGGSGALISGKGLKSDLDIEKTFSPFLQKNSDPKILERLGKYGSSTAKKDEGQAKAKPEAAKEAVPAAPRFEVTLASFLLTELKEAFQIGLIILLPFLVIDLLVANVLILLGVNHLSPEVVSLPLKLALFFAIDGWSLLAEKLLRTYI